MVSALDSGARGPGSNPHGRREKFGDRTCFPYCHLQVPQVTESDLGVKWVMINPDSFFEQIKMGHSSQCYIYSFKAILPLVPEKTIFQNYLQYVVMAAILVMWVGPIEQNFISSNP